jgi:thiamine biosynthesis lipoprotein
LIQAANVTGGCVDPTLGSLHFKDERIDGWELIEIDLDLKRVRLPEGCKLDFGSLGKSILCDIVIEEWRANSLFKNEGALVSILGDIRVGGVAPEGGWQVRVGDDHRLDKSGSQLISILQGGLATSSLLVRQNNGHSHIVDPRSGIDPTANHHWRTASVIASTCVEANTLSTCLLVGGEEMHSLLHSLPARIVTTDDVLHFGGWPLE